MFHLIPTRNYVKKQQSQNFQILFNVDEGKSGMNINNKSDLGFAHSTGINNICLVIFVISYYTIEKSAIWNQKIIIVWN